MTVDCVPHLWIPLADGTRLAARLWWPNERPSPLPALLEYLPYRKSDATAIGDPVRHAYFAEHGFVSLRVDLRGSGDSDGFLLDEYHEQELRDGEEVIAWLAAQPWCNGRVGLFGISWGGFNALQIAARRPPALKAIVSACSTDDRYADDVHYMGGAVQANDALVWATQFTAMQARPPSSAVRPGDWQARWFERVDGLPHFAARWLAHPLRDAYWRHGSVAEDYTAIDCPVLLVGGWLDPYTNTSPRLLNGLTSPRRALIGPWSHTWPNSARPGPTIAWHAECVRWWRRWLLDDTQVSASPALPDVLCFEQDWTNPGELPRDRAGRWLGFATWPRDSVATRYWLAEDALLTSPLAQLEPLVVATALRHGQGSGMWCPFGARADVTADQREDNRHALCFLAPVASADETLFGAPRLVLSLRVDRPHAQLIARLCDIAPDGAALLVSRGVRALCHDDGHTEHRPVVGEEIIEVTVELDVTAHRLRAGHRWLLAIATSYWPMVWPSPDMVQLTLLGGTLDLPRLPPEVVAVHSETLGTGDGAEVLPAQWERPPRITRDTVERDGTLTMTRTNDGGVVTLPDGTRTEQRGEDRWTARVDEPTSARVTSRQSLRRQEGGNDVEIAVDATMHCDTTHFVVEQQLEARLNGRVVKERRFFARVPRGD